MADHFSTMTSFIKSADYLTKPKQKRSSGNAFGISRRKDYTSEEKLFFVNLVVEGGNSKASVAKQYDIPESTLRGWCKPKHKDKLEKEALDRKQSSNVFDTPSPSSSSSSAGSGVTSATALYHQYKSESWKKWLQRFKLYLKAADVDIKKDDKKIAKLLHLIGEYGLEVFNTFGLDENDENLKYEDVVKKFTEYFSPRKNITMMRYQFLTRYQQKNEPMESFISDLKIKSLNCELKELRDDLVRDMIIIGMNDAQLKEKLLSRDNLKLEDVVTECRTAAITKKHVKEMQEKSCQNSNILLCTKQEDKTIDRVRCSGCHGRRHEERKCFKCGGPYQFGHKCLMKNIKCFRCNEFGHIARNCESTVRVVNVLTDVEENERFDGDYKPFFVDEIQNGDAVHESWYQDFVIQDERIRMKLDTGADANVFPIELYHELKFNKKLIVQKNISLSTVNSQIIPVKGVCTLKCWVDGKWYFIEFVLADIKCNPLIGLGTCERLGLIKRQKKREPDESDLCIAVINQKIQKKSPEPSAPSPVKSPDHLKMSVNNVECEDMVDPQSYHVEVRDAVTRRPFMRTRIFVNSNRRRVVS
ncbi:hypothetical protein WDU94_013017 [Cyamophila willieti]